MSKFLFIMSAPKSCSSTWLGILNNHPDIFLMAETLQGKKYGKNWDYYGKILGKCPNCATNLTMQNIYGNVRKKIKNDYIYFGSKWALLYSIPQIENHMKDLQNEKVLFTIRDVTTWLSHKTVINKYKLEDKPRVVEKVREYVYYYIRSFLLDDCYRVTLNNFINDNDKEIINVDKWLGNIGLYGYCDNWWDKTGKYTDPLKNAHKWWGLRGNIRKSSFTKPKKEDINVKIRDNVMWNNILPVFYKYYNSPHNNYNEEEVKKDLLFIQNVSLPNNIKLSDCYIDINRGRVG